MAVPILKSFNNPEAMKLFMEAQYGASKDALRLLANMEPWASGNRENWIFDALQIGQRMGEIKIMEDFMRTFDMKFEPILNDKELLDKLGIDLDAESP